MSARASITQTAVRLGISRQGLSKLIRQGKVAGPGDDGLLDMDQTVRDYKENTDPDRRTVNSAQLGQIGKCLAQKKPVTRPGTRPTTVSGAITGSSDGGVGTGSNLTRARTAKVAAEAKMAHLRLKKEESSLIARAEVENHAFAIGRKVRDRLRSLPDRLSIHVAKDVMPDVIEVVDGLINEMMTDLEQMAAVESETAA